jgi:hypothetical protein
MLKGFQETLPLDESRSHHAYLEAWQYGDVSAITGIMRVLFIEPNITRTWIRLPDLLRSSRSMSPTLVVGYGVEMHSQRRQDHHATGG